MAIDFKIYFINLKDREERWSNFVSYSRFYNSAIGDCIERVEAIDSRSGLDVLKGSNLRLDPVSAPHTLYFSQSKGALGCYLSHYTCWLKILEDNVKQALILEDDVEPKDVFKFLSQNPDLDEQLDLHHLGKRGFNGLEAYILTSLGANKLVKITQDPSILDGRAQIGLSGNFAGNDPFTYQYFKDHSQFSFLNRENCITSPVDKFVGYCTSELIESPLRLKHQFIPYIDLSSFASVSDIENDNFGHSFNNMTEFEINELISSDEYKWWDKNSKPLNYPKPSGIIKKKLTICVCTYNNYEILKSCLYYLSMQDANNSEYNVLVLDNTPKEKLPNFDNELFLSIIKQCDKEENFSYVHEETDGLSGARNRCVELAKSDLIHFIDDDSLTHPNFVSETLKCFNKYPELQVLGGRTIPNWDSYGRPPWLSEDSKTMGLLSMLNLGDHEIDFNNLPPEKSWFVGANICFTKESILKYGGFDTSLGRKGATNSLLGGEENELLHKIAKENLVIYCPYVNVDHVVSRERLDPSWFMKREGWQSVSEIMAGETWIDEQYGVSEFIKNNISYLFENCLTEECFETKKTLIKYLTFKLLNNGEI